MAWDETTQKDYRRNAERYESDLTDGEWAVTGPPVPPPSRLGRRRTTDLREVPDATEPGRQARDAGLGILKTCGKLGVSFSDYLADRFGMAGAPAIPKLADLIMQRSTA